MAKKSSYKWYPEVCSTGNSNARIQDFALILIGGFLILLLIVELTSPYSYSDRAEIRSAIEQFEAYRIDGVSEQERQEMVNTIAREDQGWKFIGPDEIEEHVSVTKNGEFPYSMNYRFLIENDKTGEVLSQERLYLYHREEQRWLPVTEDVYSFNSKTDIIDLVRSHNIFNQIADLQENVPSY